MDTATGRTPTLHEVQQWMAALIVSGTPTQALTPETRARARQAGALLAAPPRGGVEERLHVYIAGYPARIQESLAETYPAVAHLVGENAFASLARRFVDAIPLRSYNLNDAGSELPSFLQGDTLTAGLPFLPDLARLEWKVSRAFHANEQPSFDPTRVAVWTLEDWESAVLHFQPWVALVASGWPIRELWECRDTPLDEIDVDLCNRSDRVLVRRSGYAVQCESLDDAESFALSALLAGQTLGEVVGALTARREDATLVSAWFARWIVLRMVTGCDLRSCEER